MENSMKKQNMTMNSILFTLVMGLTLVLIHPVWGDTAKKVAIVPLEMNATQDLSFLQKGLFSMLSARISDPGKVEIIEREVIESAMARAQENPATKGVLNESKARLIGAGLDADYILFGSLTMFGESMSLDMFMVDTTGETPTLSFSRQAREQGAVITELDEIAAEINLKTFNRKPEQIVPKELYTQPREPVLQPGTYASPLVNYRLLYAGNGHINGISTGDVDGDRKNEVVIVYDHAIEILKDNLAGKLILVKRIEQPHYMDVISVDTADINNNGIDEIFVTRVHVESGYLRSIALEYTNGTFQEIADDIPWYLRVVQTPGAQKRTLYGQKSGRQGPYAGQNVFNVEWQGEKYGIGQSLRVPRGFTIMSMAVGTHIGGMAYGGILHTDREGALVLSTENGQVEWRGEPGYGGSELHYIYVDKDMDLTNESDGRGTFFQPRNIVHETGETGKSEVIVIKNNESANYRFEQIRNFKSGTIEMLRWDEMGLAPERAGKKIPGQITDIMVGDYDNGGEEKLLVSVVKNRNTFSSKKSKSIIIAYDLN